GDLPGAAGRVVHQTARRFPRSYHARSLSGHREQRDRGKKLRVEKIHRLRDRRIVFGGSAEENWVARHILCAVSEIFSDTFFPIDPPGLREGDPQNAEYSAECDALAPEFLERFAQCRPCSSVCNLRQRELTSSSPIEMCPINSPRSSNPMVNPSSGR